jgi:amino acid transporter
MFGIANIALPFFYRKEHPQDFSVLKHVVAPVVASVALLPALVAPVLPLTPAFAAAGPVPWQLIATVPITLVWLVIGIVVAATMRKRQIEQAALLGIDHELGAHPGWAQAPAVGK